VAMQIAINFQAATEYGLLLTIYAESKQSP